MAQDSRPGGPNVGPPGAAADFPRQYDADTLISYEAGVRAETPDRTLSIDASVYYLDWSDIQVLVTYNTAIGPVNADGNGDYFKGLGATQGLARELLQPERPSSVLEHEAPGVY